ncbi:MAG: RagB/SusD family nutrient uptake outer membrane protein [Rikenellaceae bacterium]|jgi:hypothetical protein|nr:RagB/SusD family nutrient uptake outer membrane protein [Rikenellaceae bacterium]
MKKFIIKPLLLACVLATAGCSDFLDRPKYGQPSGWQTREDVDKAIAALFRFTTYEEVSGRGHMWFECCSDNMVVGRSSAPAQDIREFRMAANNDRDARWIWKYMYENVAKANNIIKVTPLMHLDNDYTGTTVGIGYFFRGLSMLWLAPWYGDNGPNGGIPIILDTTEPADMDSPRPASVLMNYDQIISDMQEAGNRLPLFSQLPSDLYGYPHKAAAWAFGARAALYAAQYDARYYDTVIDFCDRIMALSGADRRDLFDDGTDSAFANLWTKANNFCSEYIFSMLGNAKEGPKYHGMAFTQNGYNLINTWGYFQPTVELMNAFDPTDKRLPATILKPGDHIRFVGRDVEFGGVTYDPVSSQNRTWNISSTTCLTWSKFLSPWAAVDCLGKDVNTDGNYMSNTLGTCLVRFADVLLMKAEALIWKNGEGDAEAKLLLNRIRKRARLPENSAATKAELKRERRLELAGEFLPSRFVDLVRWGDAQAACAQPALKLTYTPGTLGVAPVITGTEPFENGRTFNPAVNHVFPIPAAAFEGSVNLKQNQGYN